MQSPPPISARYLWWLALLLPAAALGLWALRNFDPNSASNPFPGCLFLQLTGFLCPTCGLTRAMHALVHFDLPRALSMNALFLVGGPIGLLLVLRALGRSPRRLEPWLKPISSPWLWAAVVVGFGVARNLPAFAFLAPPMG